MKTFLPISNSRKGFTLVETIVAATISLITVTAVMSTFIASSKMAVTAFRQNTAFQQARSVIDQLVTDARMASTIEASYGAYTAGPNTLILKLPSINSDGVPVGSAKFDYVVYHKSSTSSDKLVRTLVADPSSVRTSADEVVGRSDTPGVFATQPDSTGQFVIYYKFISKVSHGNKYTEIPAAGSVQLRNHV